MSVNAFLSHIADRTPKFRCFACGDDSKSLDLTANLRNTLEEPATPAELEKLQSWLGRQSEPFVNLYSHHNGLTLYEDSIGDAVGLWLYPLGIWHEQSENMKSQFEAMGIAPEEFPTGVLDTLAFGEIPHSANFFTVRMQGPSAGQIFYVDHDDFTDEPIAKSLDEFLNRIVVDPAQFLYDVGCYTRYADGKTKRQWIPKQYIIS